jgi:urea ABC transporter ATP-binding protein UrtE
MFLQVDSISVYYGKSCACQEASLQVDHAEKVCLLGRNGVGKTTLVKSIMRLLPNKNGTIYFEGTDITPMEPHEVAKLGIGYVPQGRMIFPNLTVLENLKLGTTVQKNKPKAIPELVFEFFPLLKARLKQRGGYLSGGEQQMLAIGRALSGLPKLILLDEPSEGLAIIVTEELIKILKKLTYEMGLSVFLVEQNLDMALEIATRGYVMEKGRTVAQGNTLELQDDEIVKSHLVV